MTLRELIRKKFGSVYRLCKDRDLNMGGMYQSLSGARGISKRTLGILEEALGRDAVGECIDSRRKLRAV
jgi:hypothetical protein